MQHSNKKTVAISYRYLRGYCYIGEIKLTGRHWIRIENSMIDSYHSCHFNVSDVKIEGVFNKKVVRSWKNYDDLGFEPPKKYGIYYDDEVATEYMQDIMNCFDAKTMKFNHEKALEVKKQYEQKKHESNLKESKKQNSKVHKIAETKVKTENEDEVL